ncbi:hypothetical protein O3P69_014203 [Scylla paramamosain]|uniref:Uncharacterized protein n=1 Tax=Scylla paramamosain TaxID=85552 RepID=A0AAW0SB60_SCYPA
MPSRHANATRFSPYEALPSLIQLLAHVAFFLTTSMFSIALRSRSSSFSSPICCCFETSSPHVAIFSSTEWNHLLKRGGVILLIVETAAVSRVTSSMASPFIDNIEGSLVFESERLKTFFEPRVDGTCGSVKFWSAAADITPEELAKDRFYFLKKDDQCTCIFCRGIVGATFRCPSANTSSPFDGYKEKMSSAGFYLTCLSGHVRCFKCGVGLRNWLDSMDPL